MLCQRVSDLRVALNIVPDNMSTKEKTDKKRHGLPQCQ